MSNHDLSILLFLELAFILVVIRFVSIIAKRMKISPSLTGE